MTGENIVELVFYICILGWIPILALGHAIARIRHGWEENQKPYIDVDIGKGGE